MENQSEKLNHQVAGLPSLCLASSRIQFSVHTGTAQEQETSRGWSTLLKLLQEAVPVGYVHILQIFELRQECSRSESVVTVSFQLREAVTLLSYVFCAHRNMRV